MPNADSRIMKWKVPGTLYFVLGTLYIVLRTWYFVQLVKQIPTNPQIQKGSISGVVWSHEIAFLGHQSGIQVVVLEEDPCSVDPEIQK